MINQSLLIDSELWPVTSGGFSETTRMSLKTDDVILTVTWQTFRQYKIQSQWPLQ